MHLTDAFERRRARGLPQPWPTFADWALEVLCSSGSGSDSGDDGSKLSIQALCAVLKEVFRDELDASHSKSNKDLDALARKLGLPHRAFLCLLFGSCILTSVRSYNELNASIKKLWKRDWQRNDNGETDGEVISPVQAQARSRSQSRSQSRAGTPSKAAGKSTTEAKPDNDLEKGQELQRIDTFRIHIYASILARRKTRLSAIRSKRFKAEQASIDRVTFATSHHNRAFSPSDFNVLAAAVQEHQEGKEEDDDVYDADENVNVDDDDDQEDEEAAQEAVGEEDVAAEVQDEHDLPKSNVSKTLHMRKARTTMPGSTIFHSYNESTSNTTKGRAGQSGCAKIDAKLTLCK